MTAPVTPIHARLFILKSSASGRFSLLSSPLRGVSYLEINQHGIERGRRTTTLPSFCNHDVDEQQTTFQYAPHPPRTQICSSALQLRGHPQGLSAHTVGEFQKITFCSFSHFTAKLSKPLPGCLLNFWKMEETDRLCLANISF